MIFMRRFHIRLGHPKGTPFVAERFRLILFGFFVCVVSSNGNRFHGSGHRIHPLFPPTLAVNV